MTVASAVTSNNDGTKSLPQLIIESLRQLPFNIDLEKFYQRIIEKKSEKKVKKERKDSGSDSDVPISARRNVNNSQRSYMASSNGRRNYRNEGGDRDHKKSPTGKEKRGRYEDKSDHDRKASSKYRQSSRSSSRGRDVARRVEDGGRGVRQFGGNDKNNTDRKIINHPNNNRRSRSREKKTGRDRRRDRSYSPLGRRNTNRRHSENNGLSRSPGHDAPSNRRRRSRSTSKNRKDFHETERMSRRSRSQDGRDLSCNNDGGRDETNRKSNKIHKSDDRTRKRMRSKSHSEDSDVESRNNVNRRQNKRIRRSRSRSMSDSFKNKTSNRGEKSNIKKDADKKHRISRSHSHDDSNRKPKNKYAGKRQRSSSSCDSRSSSSSSSSGKSNHKKTKFRNDDRSAK